MEGKTKKCDGVGGKNKTSERGAFWTNREGVGRGNFKKKPENNCAKIHDFFNSIRKKVKKNFGVREGVK